MDLKKIFIELAGVYPNGKNKAHELWTELEELYSGRGRHYHTLNHLLHLLECLSGNRPRIAHWNAVLFALYYHDAVYDPLKHDNEEKSAVLAEKRMHELGCGQAEIEKCRALILATKKHERNSDNDINLFTDADLSVLGASAEVYKQYAINVRKEYSIYPDLLYKPGRRKVLQHFLAMPRIFKTDEFFTRYEKQARINLAEELKGL
jgi:predicted metal-dependent HD superfamily phosphohydrolase